MTIIWMSTRKNRKNEYETETLRKKEMPYSSALKELLRALEKLEYKKMELREWSIIISKYDPKKPNDLFTITIVGLPLEIDEILSNERVKKYFA